LLTLSQCRRFDSFEGSPCERCVKDGALCEYRLVDPSSASNKHISNYQGNPVNLYHVHSAHSPKQDSALPVNKGEYVCVQTLLFKYNMNPSNSKSPSPAKERRRTPMTCTNCRSRKLKVSKSFQRSHTLAHIQLSQCRRFNSFDNSPCERCVKDGALCEYRPHPSSASNNHFSNYLNYPINL